MFGEIPKSMVSEKKKAAKRRVAKLVELRLTANRLERNVEVVSEEISERPRSADVSAEPVEDINKVEEVHILVPIEKVDWIFGKAGETKRYVCRRSGAWIEFLQPIPIHGEQQKESICQITGNKKQTESASEMVNDILNQTVRKLSLSSGMSEQQRYLHRHPLAPQRGSHPPFSYSHGYNEAKYDNHAPPQHCGPFTQGGPSTHSGYGPPQDQYNMQQPQGALPHAQPYGQQSSMPNQPVEAPYQGPAPQQQYPYAPSGPVQQTFPNPPYEFAPLFSLPTWQQAYPAAYGGYGGRSSQFYF